MKRRAWMGAALAAAVSFVPAPAEAYVNKLCGWAPTVACRWSTNVPFMYDTYSMSSGVRSQLDQVLFDWATVVPVLHQPGTASYGSWSAGDGISEIARSYTTGCAAGMLACTSLTYGAGSYIVEADVIIDPNVTYGAWDEIGYGEVCTATTNCNAGGHAYAHELGHSVGLNHSNQRFSALSSNAYWPLHGNYASSVASPTGPAADDIGGVAQAYTLYNVNSASMSAQWENPTGTLNGVPTTPGTNVVNACRGSSQTVNFTFENRGSTALSGITWSLLLSSNPAYEIYGRSGTGTGAVLIDASGYWASVGAWARIAQGITIPYGIPYGYYWVFVGITGGETSGSSNYIDDFTHLGVVFNVNCG